ncbi:NAD(P)-binding protein [Dendrothele bispora CBS 962.96]|uniref:NAD(P)-binding protein n=1 Tax=Dendrothele bispora (strain CBS 962.96) TaxID=1314807 RepID=A0A4S8KTA7_DENBC|nr:NAD(P)-binding protein [Dendrothele bispora CBS 962.96]
MASKTKVLITGATGYIGGSVLNRLLQRSDLMSSLDIRVLVRSPEKAKKFEQFGFTPVIGSHADESVVVPAVSEVDILIATTDCDNLEAAQIALKGMKKRFDSTGKQPVYIECSGTGVYVEQSGGMHSTDTVYDDANPDQIETLAPTQPHRNVDLEILAADKEGYIKAYFILPPTVWGIATGPLVDAGLVNPHSRQIPVLIKACLQHRRGGMVGAGKNVWNNVEIHELADFFIILLDAVLNNKAGLGHGREGFYNTVNGEHTHYQLAESISKALVELGLGDNPTPSTFTKEEEEKYLSFWAPFYGTNSRCLATRAKALGWNPKKTTDDVLATMKTEIDTLVTTKRIDSIGPV